MVTLAITVGWLVALIVMVSARGLLPADVHWWVWTCVCGAGMGVFGLWYVPVLKHRRARAAAARAALLAESADAGTDEEPQLSPGYASRDSDSNTVSSTDTPGKSTRS